MKINLNNKASVTLTKSGAEILNKYYSQFEFLRDQKIYVEGDIYDSQLWELTQIFGKLLYNGQINLPFKDNMINIEQ